MVAKVLTSDAGRLELHVIMPAVRLNLSRREASLTSSRSRCMECTGSSFKQAFELIDKV